MHIEHILLVDDNYTFSFWNSEFLREYGFHVVEANTVCDAVKVIDKHERLSALVTDINLGPGGDGFDIARHGRAAYPHLAVVFMSGLNRERHLSEGVEGSEFISKPFHPRQLVEALVRTINLEAA